MESIEIIREPEILKPAALYHASQNAEIETFVPRAERVRDPTEGPVIFATPDKAYASMFIVPSDDRWTSKGRYEDHDPWTFIIGDIDKFTQLDQGGAIYEFDSAPFETDPSKNMHGTEWVSKVPVTPKAKECYTSGLQAMRDNGVRILIMTPEEFKAFKGLKNEKRYDEANAYLRGFEHLG